MEVLTSQEAQVSIQLVDRVAKTADKWGVAVVILRGDKAVLFTSVSQRLMLQ